MRDFVEYDAGMTDTVDTGHRILDSFGNITSQTGISSLIGFTGRPFDETTGLQNNLNRWYDPLVGRWVSEDPIGFGGDDNNLSRYVGNLPTLMSDPGGLLEFLPPCWVGAVKQWWNGPSPPSAFGVKPNQAVVDPKGYTIGAILSGTTAKIDQNYGGGVADVAALDKAYAQLKEKYGDLSSWNSSVPPPDLVQMAIDAAATGREENWKYARWNENVIAKDITNSSGNTVDANGMEILRRGCVGIAALRMGMKVFRNPHAIVGAIGFYNESDARLELAKRPGWHLFALQLDWSRTPTAQHDIFQAGYAPSGTTFDPSKINLIVGEYNYVHWTNSKQFGLVWEWANWGWTDPSIAGSALYKYSKALPSFGTVNGKTLYIIAPPNGTTWTEMFIKSQRPAMEPPCG